MYSVKRRTKMIDAKRFGLAGGILWGGYMFLATIISLYTGYGETLLNIMGELYWGYAISWLGAFVGLAYGFVDGFISFYIIGWLYNKL
jgi:hypothetical protein